MDPVALSRVIISSEEDWFRVKDSVSSALKTSLETRLASLPGGKDGETSRRVRQELETRLQRVEDEMWNMTNPNLRVNGHNYEHYISSTEPFDEQLDRELWGINIERTTAEIEVAEMRKHKPSALAQYEMNNEERRTTAEWLPEGETDEETRLRKGKKIEVPKPDRYQETVETFAKVVENLTELTTTAPVQLARAQRAQSVREEIGKIPS